jgi:hypothetical protein
LEERRVRAAEEQAAAIKELSVAAKQQSEASLTQAVALQQMSESITRGLALLVSFILSVSAAD